MYVLPLPSSAGRTLWHHTYQEAARAAAEKASSPTQPGRNNGRAGATQPGRYSGQAGPTQPGQYGGQNDDDGQLRTRGHPSAW